MSENAKKFTPLDRGIKLVSDSGDLDQFDNDPGVLRAVLSCGHVSDPNSLTDCCKAQLNNGQTELKCPLCKKEWPYDEVRQLAKLSIDEQSIFEEMIGKNTVEKLVDLRECPGCESLIERSDVSNLSVECSICTARNGKTYEFCWQCVREWKGPRPRADRCGNVGCKSGDQELLRDCPMITLKSVRNCQCPAIRACPFCGVLIEHTNEGCKMMSCRECKKEFCFICLRPSSECLQTSNNFIPCSVGLAPRQIDSC